VPASQVGHAGGMSKILTLSGTAILSLSAAATLAAVSTGTAQWVGLVAPFAVPPQSLVVGGLFLGIPITALGWGMIWFGRWMAEHR
jgi:hypothetical protein